MVKHHDRGLKNVDKWEEPLTLAKAEMEEEDILAILYRLGYVTNSE